VNAPLAAFGRGPLKMLHDVRDVNFVAVDTGLHKGLVEYFSRRANKRMAREIFLISRLFAYEQDRCLGRSFSEHCLRGIFPEIASSTIPRGSSQAGERRPSLLRNLATDFPARRPNRRL